MNWTMISLISGAVGIALSYLGGLYIGEQLGHLDELGKQQAQADKIIVRREVEVREIPKIVTHVVTVTVTTEKEYNYAITKVDDLFSPDCVMPKWWGELFVNAANGLGDTDPRSSGQEPGTYGCLETAKATLKDLKAGNTNTAQLAGLQQFSHLSNRSGQ